MWEKVRKLPREPFYLYFFHRRLIQSSFTIQRLPDPQACAQNNMTADSLTIGIENLFHYIFPGRSHILPSYAPPMQFMWHICHRLFTLRHSCTFCFKIHTNQPVKSQYVTMYGSNKLVKKLFIFKTAILKLCILRLKIIHIKTAKKKTSPKTIQTV